MCLQVLSEEVKREYKNQNYGWKILREPYKTVYYSNRDSLSVGKWLNEKDYRPFLTVNVLCCEDDVDTEYPTGWHIYLDEEDALMEVKVFESAGMKVVVKKVFFRKPLAWGKQNWDDDNGYTVPTVVAEEIMIVEQAGMV